MSKLYCYDGAHGTDPHGRVLELSAEHRKLFDTKLPPGRSDLGVVVFDQAREEVLLVIREDCGLNCYCAARALDPANAIEWARDA